MSGNTLVVRVFPDYWQFESPPGVPFQVDHFAKSKIDAAKQLFSQRYYLRDSLQRKIRQEIKWDSKWGIFKQLLIPLNGLLLTDTFDLDLDTGTLAQDVAAELSTVFSPQEYRVVDSIMEGKFREGKALLKVIF